MSWAPKSVNRTIIDAALLGRKPLARQKLRIEEPPHVQRPAIAEERHDSVPGTHLARYVHRSSDVDPGRAADEEPVAAKKLVDHRNALAVGDAHRVVDRRVLEIGGDAARADALGDRGAFELELAVLDEVEERAAHRIGEHDLHRRLLFFEIARDAGERAAGARRADEGVDAAVGIAPDLRPRG